MTLTIKLKGKPPHKQTQVRPLVEKVDYDGIILDGPRKGQKLKSKKLLKLFRYLERNPDA